MLYCGNFFDVCSEIWAATDSIINGLKTNDNKQEKSSKLSNLSSDTNSITNAKNKPLFNVKASTENTRDCPIESAPDAPAKTSCEKMKEMLKERCSKITNKKFPLNQQLVTLAQEDLQFKRKRLAKMNKQTNFNASTIILKKIQKTLQQL